MQPNNLYILLNHIKCAAYELPFEEGERFRRPARHGAILEYLTENNILRHVEASYYWMEEELPLRRNQPAQRATENFVIIDITNPPITAWWARWTASPCPCCCTKNAIYMHDGACSGGEAGPCRLQGLHPRRGRGLLHRCGSQRKPAHSGRSGAQASALRRRRGPGRMRVSTIVKMFKKFKLDTHESVGFGEVRLPQTDLHHRRHVVDLLRQPHPALWQRRAAGRARWWASPTCLHRRAAVT